MSELFEKILLALDGSEESTLAARTANGLARKLGSELYVVHVGAMPSPYAFPESAVLDPEFRDQMRGRAEREAGAILDEQVKRVAEAGGVSGSVVRHARCPVLVVRSDNGGTST